MAYAPANNPYASFADSPLAPAVDIIPVVSGVEYDYGKALRIYVPLSVSVITINVVGANTSGVSRALKFTPGTYDVPLATISVTWSDSSVEIHRYR